MVLEEIKENLIKGKAEEVKKLTKKALEEKTLAKEILDNGLIAGMSQVGKKFKANEFFLPEVLVAARAMKEGMKILEPHLVKSNIKAKAKVAIGTVKGDLHDIGKNLVIMMWQGAGFEVIDLGIDVSSQKFLEVVKNEEIQILGMSALLTTTMLSMKEVIEIFKKEKVRNKIKIMIGGAPITQKFADEIGADGFAPDAASAVDKAKEILKIN